LATETTDHESGERRLHPARGRRPRVCGHARGRRLRGGRTASLSPLRSAWSRSPRRWRD